MTRASSSPRAPWSAEKASRRVLTRDTSWAQPWIDKLLAACHPKQRAAALDPASQVTVLAPRGGTKTTGALVRLYRTMGLKRRARCRFIATTKDHAADIVWEKMKKTAEVAGIDATFTETGKVCTFDRNGSLLKLIGADDRKEVEKLRGIALDGVVIDETASHPPALLEQMIDRGFGPRLAERDGWCMMIGTPGHQLSGIFYDATRPGGPAHRPYDDRDLPEWKDFAGWSSHWWSMEYAALHVPAARKLWEAALRKKKEKGWSDQHPLWLREYMGKWAADDTENVFRYRPHTEDGAPWNQWDPERVGPYRFAKLPEGRDDWQYAYVFDAGYRDPFAVNIFAFSPSDPTKAIYHAYGSEKADFYARLLAVLFLGEDLNTDKPEGLFGITGWPVGIVGDTDEALLAELSNVYGIRATQAIRRRDYKVGAIELCNGDFVDGRLKILKGSLLESQLSQLQWATDEWGNLRENKAQANHSTDCLVHGRKLIAHLFESGQLSDEEAKARRARDRRDRREVEVDSPRDDDWSDLLSSGTYDVEDPW